MKSYLSDRYQCVNIFGDRSDKVKMRYGVPQGSVLGPKLFCAYTRPLGGIIVHHNGMDYHVYADDTQLYIEINLNIPDEPEASIETIQLCIRDIQRWMRDNALKLNSGKTELMFFASPRNAQKLEQLDLHISVGSDVIIPATCVRNLGVMQDTSLTMKNHVSRVCKESYKLLHCIRRIRPYLSYKACNTLMRSLILSKIDYGNALLCGATKSALQPLQRFQNVCARVVSKVPRRAHITPSLVHLHWLPILKRIDYKLALFVYNFVYGKTPGYMSPLLSLRPAPRSLRSSSDLLVSVPKFRTETYGRSRFGVRAPVLWNSLPPKVRNCTNTGKFKKVLKTHLFDLAYFS